ncbi:MAG: redox-regulated ATPase YchF [Candidatus Woesearchaeota archaeon]
MMLIGVVGKANVGKSTFFKSLTLADIEIANYPFATINPNKGVGFVKIDCVCKEFDKQCNPREGYCTGKYRFIAVDVIDVAGLVPGAHEGKGMGNQFLDDLRQANCLIHVIDCSGSTNERGESVTPGSYNPEKDILFLEVELDMWYLGILKKGWEKLARQIQQESLDTHKVLAKQLSGLGVSEDMIKESLRKLNYNIEKPISWTEDELAKLASHLRKLTKPMVIAANKVDTETGKKNYEELKKKFNDRLIIPCSAESELVLRQASKANLINYVPGENNFKIIAPEKLNEKQLKALDFIQKNVLDVYGSTGVINTLNSAVFDLLEYMAIFPGGVGKMEDQHGNVLPDCFLMPKNTTALDFAFKLHTDLGKGFIKAIDVKTKMVVGKDHKLKHRDVIEIASKS